MSIPAFSANTATFEELKEMSSRKLGKSLGLENADVVVLRRNDSARALFYDYSSGCYYEWSSPNNSWTLLGCEVY